jgi:hypothetical protein
MKKRDGKNEEEQSPTLKNSHHQKAGGVTVIKRVTRAWFLHNKGYFLLELT